jgi:hypothetical protein
VSYDAKIVLDSVGPNDARVTTFELTMPRIVLAEFNTHRMFSRNAASSRAIPVEKLLKRIEDDPMLPVWWGKNQSGMQAAEELDPIEQEAAKRVWLYGRDQAIDLARNLADSKGINLHKQIANRIVEPWMFTTVVCTATEWDNAWGLRVDPMAQPEFERVMHKAYDQFKSSIPQKLSSGDWHLPYVTGNDGDTLRSEGYSTEDLCYISIGRCARVSYLTHDGKRDPSADIDLPKGRLIPSGHMSPTEHAVQAMSKEEWLEYGVKLATEWVNNRVPVGNVWGFKQFRKTIKNEHNFMLLKKKSV